MKKKEKKKERKGKFKERKKKRKKERKKDRKLGFITYQLCRFFNAKIIFMKIFSTISNNSV